MSKQKEGIECFYTKCCCSNCCYTNCFSQDEVKEKNKQLFKAVKNNNLEEVRLLIDNGADVNCKDEDDLTPLQGASRWGYFEIYKLLIDHGVDVDCKNNKGWTPLHEASYKGNIDICKLLIEKGADVNCKDKDGWTPLYVASWNDHLDICKLLIEKGADINCKNKDGKTPLDVASQYGYFEICKFLIDHGVDVDCKTKYIYKDKSLDYDKDYAELLHKYCRDGIIKCSFSCILVDICYPSCHRPFNKSFTFNIEWDDYIKSDSINQYEELITKAFFPPFEKDSWNVPEYHTNIKRIIGNINALQKLLIEIKEKGIDINTLTNKRSRCSLPLMHIYDKDILKLLLDAGADVNRKDMYGKTVLMENYDKDTLHTLIEHGAKII
jgi:ankyrin repeat protein